MTAFSPRLTRDGDVDTTTIDTLLAHPRFSGLAGEALAVELWRFVCERFYHWFPPFDAAFGNEYLTDPVMLINSYGFAICGTAANLLATLCHDAGMPARNVSLPGHRVTEVFYDDAWHLFDADLKAFHRLHPPRQDVIASLADLIADHTLVTDQRNPSDPYYIEDRPPHNAAKAFVEGATTDRVVPSHWHSMDFVLPPGGEIEYRYGNDGKWVCHDAYRAYFEKYPNEPGACGPAERMAPHRTYANGALRLRATRGATTMRVSCPHPFAGIPDPAFASPPRDGAVVTIGLGDGDAARIGLRARAGDHECWTDVARASPGDVRDGFWRVDVTPLAAGRTSIDLEIDGSRSVASFEFEGTFVCAPSSLSALRRGHNELRLFTGDGYGLPTETRHLDAHFSRTDAFAGGLELEDGVHDVASAERVRPTGNGPYQIVAPLRAPPGTRLAWFYALAYPQARVPGARRDDDVRLELAPRRDGPWRVLARWDLVEHPDRWHFSVEHTHRFNAPVEECFIRYAARTGMKGVRVRTHCLAGDVAAGGRVEVDMRWVERGREREDRHVFTPDAPAFHITCDDDPEMRAVILRCLPE